MTLVPTNDEFDEKHKKIKFNSYDELTLNIIIKISSIVIVFRAIFDQNKKH